MMLETKGQETKQVQIKKREKWKKHILALITGLAWECCFDTEAARRVGTSQFEIPPATILGYFE